MGNEHRVHFEQVYRDKPDEELFELWLKKDTLTDDAAAALTTIIGVKRFDLHALAAEQSEVDYQTDRRAAAKGLKAEQRQRRLFKVLAFVAVALFLVRLAINPVLAVEEVIVALFQATGAAAFFALIHVAVRAAKHLVRQRRK
jgi:hypothetical protein